MKVMIFRLASSAILVITSIVVLGISAHVESSVSAASSTLLPLAHV